MFARLFLLCSALALSPGHAALEVTDVREDGSETTVRSVFSTLPSRGYAPLLIKAKNSRPAPLPLSLTFTCYADSNTYQPNESVTYKWSATAAPITTTDAEILVPVCGHLTGSHYNSPTLQIAFSSQSQQNLSNSGGGPSNSGGSFFALSATLAPGDIATLDHDSAGQNASLTRTSASFQPSHLPSQWLGYSGVDTLLIPLSEWHALSTPQRTALTQWTTAGGSLILAHRYDSTSLPALDTLLIPHLQPSPDSPTSHSHGLGSVTLYKLGTAPSITLAECDALFRSLPRTSTAAPLADVLQKTLKAEKDGLHAALGHRPRRSWLAGLLILAFGIIVGPVNLFVFAKSGRRHRLFFTAPLISLLFAIALFIIVLLGDGIGGHGVRAASIYLDSQHHTTLLHQEQIARTGLLLRGSFQPPPQTVIYPTPTPSSDWALFSTAHSHDPTHHAMFRQSSKNHSRYYTIAPDGTHGGAYFQSRRELGHTIRSLSTTRSTLELTLQDGIPHIASRLPVSLENVLYRDATGKPWGTTQPLTTGATLPLSPISEDYHTTTLKATKAALSAPSQASLLHTAQRKNYFHAHAPSAAPLMAPTHLSIDWTRNTACLHGPLSP